MIEKIAAQIKARLGTCRPETAVILGSGLGALGDLVENPVIIPYAEIEGFPQSTVSGHKGRLIIGRLEGKDILCMQGRVHLYEGHSPQNINTFIKAFQLLGIKNLIVTNASGSLTADLPAGTIMLISDHINLSGTNPLIGPNDDAFGPRFPDMSNAYDAELRTRARQIAARENVPLAEGVYACPIVKLEADPEVDDEIPALTIYRKRNINVETERKPRNRSTEITADEFYVAALTNEAKVVLAKFKK